MKIAFLTSGGIIMSENVLELTENYFKNYPEVEIIGYLNGYKGLLLGKSINFQEKIINNIKNI